jgi:DNA topoisomerase-3
MIRLSDDLVPEFDFGQGAADADTPVDFSGSETLGPCPKCGKRIFEHGMSYVCEAAVGPARTCDFRSGKIILQRPIEREQMQKLLATGKTDLLHKFISKKGRPFSAFLVRGGDGKVGFEFAPRVAKAGAKAVAKSPAATYDIKPSAKLAAKSVVKGVPVSAAKTSVAATPMKSAAKAAAKNVVKAVPVSAAKRTAAKAVAKKTAVKKAVAKKTRRAA